MQIQETFKVEAAPAAVMTGLSFRMWLGSVLGTTHDYFAIGQAGPSIWSSEAAPQTDQ